MKSRSIKYNIRSAYDRFVTRSVPQTMANIAGQCTGTIWKETAILQTELYSGIYMT